MNETVTAATKGRLRRLSVSRPSMIFTCIEVLLSKSSLRVSHVVFVVGCCSVHTTFSHVINSGSFLRVITSLYLFIIWVLIASLSWRFPSSWERMLIWDWRNKSPVHLYGVSEKLSSVHPIDSILRVRLLLELDKSVLLGCSIGITMQFYTLNESKIGKSVEQVTFSCLSRQSPHKEYPSISGSNRTWSYSIRFVVVGHGRQWQPKERITTNYEWFRGNRVQSLLLNDADGVFCVSCDAKTSQCSSRWSSIDEYFDNGDATYSFGNGS